MATLKDGEENCTASGIRRRDFRNTKAGPEEIPKKPTAKNTKKWCKGKEGRTHVLSTTNTWWVMYRCVNCGKEFWCMKQSDRKDYRFAPRDYNQ